MPTVGQGTQVVTVTRSGSVTPSNGFNFSVYQAKLIPVTFTINNASPTNPGDNIYLTGNTVELGNWATTTTGAVGAMLTTPTTYPNWWLTVSVPAGKVIQYKAIKIQANGTVTWENGANHSYTVPASGVRSPSAMRTSVDLPAPFGPRMAMISPACTASDAPRTMGRPGS